MRSRIYAKTRTLLSAEALVLFAALVGCADQPRILDVIADRRVGVNLVPVATSPDTCRIDMSVTNVKNRGSVKPRFKMQIISRDEWAGVPPLPSYTSIRPLGRKEDISFGEIPAGQTVAKTLAKLDMPCSELEVFAFWEACHVSGMFAELLATVDCTAAVLTPWGKAYFNEFLSEPMVQGFHYEGLVECPPSDPVCSGPIHAERIPLGHIESLTSVAEPEHDQKQVGASGPRVDFCIERTLVDEQTCEVSMTATNLTEDLTIKPLLEVEIGLLSGHFPDSPRAWPSRVSFGSVAPFYSSQRVVGTLDLPCWGLDTLTFRKVCHQQDESCEDLLRSTGKSFQDRESGEYLTVPLKNTPMYRRP